MDNMDYPVEKIKEMCGWIFFQGFTGDTCGFCKKNGNVLAGSPGYMCPNCGQYNVLPWLAVRIPFKSPDFGPPQARIQEAYQLWKKENGGEDVHPLSK